MKLIVDMNLSPRWVGLLAGAGVQAVHWSMIGRHNAPDSEIMAYATANDYIVLTHDLDFSAFLRRRMAKNQVSYKSVRKISVRTQLARRSLPHCGRWRPT